MIEKVRDGIGGKSLRVFPFLPDDAPEEQTVFAACVEAMRHYDDPDDWNSARTWKVQVNVASCWMTREEGERLRRALARALEWVGEQEGEQQAA